MSDRFIAKVTRTWMRGSKRVVQADVYVDGWRIGSAVVVHCSEKNDYEPDGDDWCTGKLHRVLSLISSGVNRWQAKWEVVSAIEAALDVYDEPAHAGAFVSNTHAIDRCHRSHRPSSMAEAHTAARREHVPSIVAVPLLMQSPLTWSTLLAWSLHYASGEYPRRDGTIGGLLASLRFVAGGEVSCA